jgi:hypothetical protein
MNLGIVSFHNAHNYGAVLQCYALSETVKKLGYQVELIDFPLDKKPKGLRAILSDMVLSRAFSDFRISHLPNIVGSESAKDCYIFGSDQIWNPQITEASYDVFFGSWVPASIPKIAYAASFGLSIWEFPSYTKAVKDQLDNFRSISVRESSGVDICEKVFSVDCEKVLDPTLLLEEYTGIYRKQEPSKSLVVYLLCRDEAKIKEVRRVGERYQLGPVILKDFRFRANVRTVAFPSVSKWLGYLESGSLILTDSYHCMVFAIIFKKNFVVVPAVAERVDRMLSLLKDLGLESRFFQDIGEINAASPVLDDIDFVEVDKKLKLLRQSSLEYLKTSLSRALS